MRAPTLGPAFARILTRELDRLVRQLEAYPDEESLWRTGGEVKNSAGTLALHLVGNLEHFVGAGVGGTGYVRDREAEFGDRDVPRAEIVARIRSCRATMRASLETRSDEALLKPYPSPLPGTLAASLDGDATGAAMLAHLVWHLGWHLGQIDYHRRLLVGGDAV